MGVSTVLDDVLGSDSLFSAIGAVVDAVLGVASRYLNKFILGNCPDGLVGGGAVWVDPRVPVVLDLLLPDHGFVN